MGKIKTSDYEGNNRRKISMGDAIRTISFFGAFFIGAVLFWNNTNKGIAANTETNKCQNIEIKKNDEKNRVQDLSLKVFETKIETIGSDVKDIKNLLYKQYGRNND